MCTQCSSEILVLGGPSACTSARFIYFRARMHARGPPIAELHPVHIPNQQSEFVCKACKCKWCERYLHRAEFPSVLHCASSELLVFCTVQVQNYWYSALCHKEFKRSICTVQNTPHDNIVVQMPKNVQCQILQSTCTRGITVVCCAMRNLV